MGAAATTGTVTSRNLSLSNSTNIGRSEAGQSTTSTLTTTTTNTTTVPKVERPTSSSTRRRVDTLKSYPSSESIVMQTYLAPRARGGEVLISTSTKPAATTPSETPITSTQKRQSSSQGLPKLIIKTPVSQPATIDVASPTNSLSNSKNRDSGVFSSTTHSTLESNPVSPTGCPSSTTRVYPSRSRPASPGMRNGTLPGLSQTSQQPASSLPSSASATPALDVRKLNNQANSIVIPASAPTGHRRLASQSSNGPVIATAVPSATVKSTTSTPIESVSPHARKTLQPSSSIRPPPNGAVSPPNELASKSYSGSDEGAGSVPSSVPNTSRSNEQKQQRDLSQNVQSQAKQFIPVNAVASLPISGANTQTPNSPQSTNSTNNDRPSGMVSPTTFMNIHQLYSEENPEFVEYKKKWEAMREVQTALRRAGGLKEGRSLLSPVNSPHHTRNHSRAASVAASPRALSPFSPGSGDFSHGSFVFPSPGSPMHTPSQADGVTSFDFPVPLPVDELGEELATPCSPVPGPFVHAGSLFAILVESNRNSPLPSSPIPGYKILPEAMAGRPYAGSSPSPLPYGGHHRSKTQGMIALSFGSGASSPVLSRSDSRNAPGTNMSHARRSSVPNAMMGGRSSPGATIPEETTPAVSRDPSAAVGGYEHPTQVEIAKAHAAASQAMFAQQQQAQQSQTDWRHVERRLNGLAVSTANHGANTPSPPPIVSPTHREAAYQNALQPPTAHSQSQQQSQGAALPPRGPSPLPAARARITILPASALPPSNTASNTQQQQAGLLSSGSSTQAPTFARSDSSSSLKPSRRTPSIGHNIIMAPPAASNSNASGASTANLLPKVTRV